MSDGHASDGHTAYFTPVSKLTELTMRDEFGVAVGKIRDVVVRWDGGQEYPVVLGLVVDSPEGAKFAPIGAITNLFEADAMPICHHQMGVWERRQGELCLIKDVVGRQIVDIDGLEVFRARELFLGFVYGALHLIAVSGKKRSYQVVDGVEVLAKGKIVDWATVQPFGGRDSELRLKMPHEGLRKLRPGELADILEDLDSVARGELTSQIDVEQIADAFEEMQSEEVGDFLADTDPNRAAEILARMEPDEAVDALRDLARSDADEILSHMPEEVSAQLNRLLGYPEAMVGGFMTTRLITARPSETIEEVRTRLRGSYSHVTEIDAVAVVDANGILIDDISLFDLATVEPGSHVSSLISGLPPITLEPDAFVKDAVEALRESRRSSVVVVNQLGIPIGRVLADDLVDALVKSSGFHFRLPWVR